MALRKAFISRTILRTYPQIRRRVTTSLIVKSGTSVQLANRITPVQDRSCLPTGLSFRNSEILGLASIVRATMTPHQVCASRCSFCSTINRSRKDAISLDEAKAFVIDLDEKQALFNKEHFPEHNQKYRDLTGSGH